MVDIILIQPKAGAFDMLGARLPNGLLSIAAPLYRQGWSIKIIDQRIDSDWQNTLLTELKTNPLCVGITCMTGKQIFYALEASKIVKQHSKCPVIFGGVHATLLPEETMQNKNIDIIVLREGDMTFLELVGAIKNNKPFKDILGIYYKEEGQIMRTPDRPFIKNLDELPELPYGLIKMDKYSSMDISGGRSLDFVTSRGCPYKCAFCYNNFFNHRMWRAFSAEETVRRLSNVVRKYKIKTVYFQDDNFCVDLTRLKKILQGIIKENLKIKWGTLGLRVDTAMKMDKEILDLMKESGCINVDIGAESGSARILDMIDKEINIQELLAVNKKLAKYPFIVKYTFIIGFPTETQKEMSETVRIALKLVKDNKKAYTPFSVYSPYPGSPMYDFAIKQGFHPPKNLMEWGKFSGDDWYFTFKSWMPNSKIRKVKSIAFTSLFSNKNIKYKITKPLTKILFNLYHPLAKLRFENNLHFFPIDSLLSRKLLYNKL